MTDQWNSSSGVHDAPAPDAGYDSARTGTRGSDRWRRPIRSTGDRKIAGVAGGLGRAFGVDPILLRVAFVVLTIFGGVGGLLYVLGWLLLPADGDEVSAAEALLGRGRSSVPPSLTVGLGVVAVISAFSMFSWGLPFLPLAIGGLVVLAVLRRRGHGQCGPGARLYDWHGKDWDRSATGPTDARLRNDDRAQAFSQKAERWGEQAQRWADQAHHWGERVEQRSCGGRRSDHGWGHGGRGSRSSVDAPQRSGSSPFQRPAFWEQPSASTRVDGPAPEAASRVDLTKGSAPTEAAGWLGPDGTPRTTPPAWDPLGVAPFAWDLPEPAPLPVAPARQHRAGVLPQVALGATLLVAGVTAAGVFAGWWALTWAQVSAIALAVLATGLLFSALRGGGRSLIGPGVFLSLVTMALAVTGISGTSGYGVHDVRPANLAEVQDLYAMNAGELDVDLSAISIPRGTTKTVDVEVKAGHALVHVPAGVTVDAVCSADVGRTDCLGGQTDGVRRQSQGTVVGGGDAGTLHLQVKVHAGFAEVVSGD